MSAFVAAAPYVFLLVMLCIAMMATFKNVVGWRNATAGMALTIATTMLSIGVIIGTMRKRRDQISLSTNVNDTPSSPSTARGNLVTRESVCTADDIDAPHTVRIKIDPHRHGAAQRDGRSGIVVTGSPVSIGRISASAWRPIAIAPVRHEGLAAADRDDLWRGYWPRTAP